MTSNCSSNGPSLFSKYKSESLNTVTNERHTDCLHGELQSSNHCVSISHMIMGLSNDSSNTSDKLDSVPSGGLKELTIKHMKYKVCFFLLITVFPTAVGGTIFIGLRGNRSASYEFPFCLDLKREKKQNPDIRQTFRNDLFFIVVGNSRKQNSLCGLSLSFPPPV